ncbi:MAG: RNA-guided endonuclease InsQ/TnpB family protein [Promethearchaeota archaeon]
MTSKSVPTEERISLLSTMRRVIRTEQIWVKPFAHLSNLCHHSNALYNQATYLVRHHYFATKEWLRYPQFYHELKTSPHYQALPAQTAQQILKLVEKNFKSFFNAITAKKKNPRKFKDTPKFPYYKKSGSEFSLFFTNQQIRLKKGVLHLPKKILQKKTRFSKETVFRGARIHPRGDLYLLEVLYEIEVPMPEPKHERMIAIDLGVNNLVTMINNFGELPIAVKGGVAKSINQWYNKIRSHLQSHFDKNKLEYNERKKKIDFQRNKQIKDLFHKLSCAILNYCLYYRVDTIVIGYNPLWKQKVNLGKVNNQNFVSLPFLKLLQMIQYKAEDHGICVIIVEEAYTSKCSFLDQEPIKKHATYVGKRLHRGMFRSKNGTFINADVNSAYNILRKVFPKAFPNGIEDVGLHPHCIKFVPSGTCDLII